MRSGFLLKRAISAAERGYEERSPPRACESGRETGKEGAASFPGVRLRPRNEDMRSGLRLEHAISAAKSRYEERPPSRACDPAAESGQEGAASFPRVRSGRGIGTGRSGLLPECAIRPRNRDRKERPSSRSCKSAAQRCSCSTALHRIKCAIRPQKVLNCRRAWCKIRCERSWDHDPNKYRPIDRDRRCRIPY